jgi:hypothetical protein
VQEYKKDLQSQMIHIKQEEEQKRKKLQEQIAQQKEQIRTKEQMINEKRKKLEMVSIKIRWHKCLDGE